VLEQVHLHQKVQVLTTLSQMVTYLFVIGALES